MPYIEIVEKDETTPGASAEKTDVVYIPGFVDTTQSSLNRNGEYIGIEANVPTLFTSVKQFESLCGTHPAVFEDKQLYRDLQSYLPNGDISGFSAEAIPYHNVMFEAGMSDPAYIMAKEYLNAGLNVLFERVNGDSGFVAVTEEPQDWASSYTNYYGQPKANDTGYGMVTKLITDVTPPVWYKRAEAGTIVEDVTKYWKPIYEENKLVSFQLGQLTKGYKITYDDEYYIHNGRTFYKWDGTYKKNTSPVIAFVEDFYYTKDTNDNITVISKKEDLIKAISDNVDIFRQNMIDITCDTDGVMQVINEEWVNTYYQHYECYYPILSTTNLLEYKSFSELTAVINIYKVDNSINIKTMYNALEGLYDSSNINGLADKGNYSIKYLTSGGYPVYEYNKNSIVNKMINLAHTRGDCVAFIDHTDNTQREDNIDLKGSIYHTVKNDETFNTNGEFATMFTPWASYNRTTSDKDDEGKIIKSESIRMPASYAYFNALGDSIRTNANWLAIAGSARGVVPNLATKGMTTNIPNGAADAMQPRDGIAVNAITNIKPYGWTIWGNRTLKNNAENLTATSFLNTRNLISDVKKTAYKVARKLTFEQNNDILWVNFKGLISPTLDRMLSGYGISGYKIVRDTEHEKASEKATVCAKIILYPVYAVEDFYITIVLKDDEVNVE